MFILAFLQTFNKIIIDNDSIFNGEYTILDNTVSEINRVWINEKTNVIIKYVENRWCLTFNDNILAEATEKNNPNFTKLIFINPPLPIGLPAELFSTTIK